MYKFKNGDQVVIFPDIASLYGIVRGRDSYSPNDTHWYAVEIVFDKFNGGFESSSFMPVREDLLEHFSPRQMEYRYY